MTSGLVAVLAAALLSGCGSSAAPEAAPTSSASQAPVQAYTDTGADDADTAPPPTASERAQLARVHIVAVSIAAKGHYVSVQFRAPPRLADGWRSGPLSVTDERTHRVYDQIPNMPVIGSLFAPPHKEGQIGYVMFANVPPLGVGARLTVVLGDFKKAHVEVKEGGTQ